MTLLIRHCGVIKLGLLVRFQYQWKKEAHIDDKFEFLMKYQNMGSYAHFAPFLKVIILLVSEILSKNGVKSVVSEKSCNSSLMQ